jgi:hypothetical protein
MTAPVIIQDESGPMVECPLCEGVGGEENVTADGIWYTWGVCPDCNGSGLVPYVAETGAKPKLAKSEPPPAAKEGAGR